ncbi:MAG: hypothetical protein BRD24_05450 [Halobacteriales archaeon SW_9_67_24]|nr:MAG: hypothetical protein BRD24_05450 [Halobacteriales archaeon SW_9_67_24]
MVPSTTPLGSIRSAIARSSGSRRTHRSASIPERVECPARPFGSRLSSEHGVAVFRDEHPPSVVEHEWMAQLRGVRRAGDQTCVPLGDGQ